jgi:large subunit ribosomal protein L29
MKENADKVRALDTTEIRKQLSEAGEQAFRLRFQMSMGQADGLKKLRMMRKERARMLTILREREMNPDNAAPKPVKKAKAEKAAKAAKPAKAAAKPKAEPKVKKAAAPKAAVKADKKPAVKKAAKKEK